MKPYNYDIVVATHVRVYAVEAAEIRYRQEYTMAVCDPDKSASKEKVAEVRKLIDEDILENLEALFPGRERWAWEQYLLMREAEVEFAKNFMNGVCDD